MTTQQLSDYTSLKQPVCYNVYLYIFLHLLEGQSNNNGMRLRIPAPLTAKHTLREYCGVGYDFVSYTSDYFVSFYVYTYVYRRIGICS